MPTVRLASPTDATPISDLVIGLADDSLVDPSGEEARHFRSLMAPSEITRYLGMPTRFYAVAEVDGEVRGMIMVLNDNYVGQFFVSRSQQGRGVGSALWRFAFAHALQRGGTGEFSVKSSLAAVPVYTRFGFTATGAVEEAHGFRYVPMRKDTSPSIG